MKKIEDILAEAIEEINSGHSGIEDFLNLYQDYREELGPLLKLVLGIKPQSDAGPSDEFKIGGRVWLIDRIASEQSVTQASPLRYKWLGTLIPRRFNMATAFIAIVMVLSLAGGGTVYASQDSLPGEILYPVKITSEQARLILADDATDTRLWLEFAQNRLDEMNALNEKGRPQEIDSAISGYELAISNSIAKLEGVKTEELSALVAEAVSKHLYILDNLEDVVPAQAREALARASQASLNGLQNSMRALATDNPERAMELNLSAMESRLNRIKALAEAGKPVNENGPLAQYEELRNFGNEISGIARELKLGTTTIEQLITQPTSIHLEVLADVYERVPEAAKESVEKAMENSIDGHQKARQALEQAGASDKIPAELPNPPNMPDRIKDKLEEMIPAKSDTTSNGGPPEEISPGGPPRSVPSGRN